MSKGLYADFLLTHLQSANTELFGYALFDGVKHPLSTKSCKKVHLNTILFLLKQIYVINSKK